MLEAKPILISGVGVTLFLIVLIGFVGLAFTAVMRNAGLIIANDSKKKEITRVNKLYLDAEIRHHCDRNKLQGAYSGMILALRGMDNVPDTFYDDLRKKMGHLIVDEIRYRVNNPDLDPHFDSFEYPFTVDIPKVKLGDTLRCGSTTAARSNTLS